MKKKTQVEGKCFVVQPHAEKAQCLSVCVIIEVKKGVAKGRTAYRERRTPT